MTARSDGQDFQSVRSEVFRQHEQLALGVAGPRDDLADLEPGTTLVTVNNRLAAELFTGALRDRGF